ncbi:hypothetical protein GGR58DRAFT_478302 [Xylaria digitata]|nr:hypothetical protein GGR58DRAFT_478302 [Xylaria digitata]
MFSTLQYDSTSNGPFVVQSTLPPFERKRPAKLTRLACVNCRISKLKCSGEHGGCQRCRAKEIECCYPKTPNGRRNMKNCKHPTIPSKPASQANYSPSSQAIPLSSPETPTNNTQFDLAEDGISPQDTLDSNIDHWLPQKDFQGHFCGDLSTDLAVCSDKVAQSPEGGWQPMGPADTTPPSPMMDADTTGIRSPTVSGDAESEIPSLTGISFDPDLLCFCFSDAIGTYDYIQTTLVWKQHTRTITSGSLLQSQKRALSECEKLLTCTSCTSQSKYITLLIVMYENLLSSMENGCQIQSLCSQWNGEGATEPWSEITGNEDRQQGGNQGKDLGGLGGETVDRSEENYKVAVGRWQLDSDDELLVIQSLFSARVARLLNLVAKVERIASEHRWSSQSRRICDIRERCHSLSRQLKEYVSFLSYIEV